MYGLSSVRAAVRFLRWASTPANTVIEELYAEQAFEVLKLCYQLKVETQDYNQCPDAEHTADPRLNKHHSGIAVFDLTTPQPTYCYFAAKHYTFWPFRIPLCHPFSASEYLDVYYPPAQYDAMLMNPDDRNEFVQQIKDAKNATWRYAMITHAQLREIFPKMYDGVNLNRRLAATVAARNRAPRQRNWAKQDMKAKADRTIDLA